MYTLHLSVLRTSLARSVGGFRSAFDSSQDYDLVLRVSEVARTVHHVPEVLYHWRSHPGSTAAVVDQKPEAFGAARRAVQDHCRRVGLNCTAESDGVGFVRVRRQLDRMPRVTVVIVSSAEATRARSVARTDYSNVELVILDRTDPDRLSLDVTRAVSAATGEYVVLLDDVSEIMTEAWIEELLALVLDPTVSAAGGLGLPSRRHDPRCRDRDGRRGATSVRPRAPRARHAGPSPQRRPRDQRTVRIAPDGRARRLPGRRRVRRDGPVDGRRDRPDPATGKPGRPASMDAARRSCSPRGTLPLRVPHQN